MSSRSDTAAWLRQQEELRKTFRFFESPAWLRQQEELRKTLRLFESPAWLRQQEELRKTLRLFESPAWLKQQEALRKSFAFTESPAWLKQRDALRNTLASLAAFPQRTEWLIQLEALRRSLDNFGASPAGTRISMSLGSSAILGANPGWIRSLDADELDQQVDEFVELGLPLPSDATEAIPIANLVGDEVGFLAALPLIYRAAPPALRRKLKYSLAALAAAAGFYIAAIAEGRLGDAVNRYLVLLLALWASLNALLEGIEQLEAEGLKGAED